MQAEAALPAPAAVAAKASDAVDARAVAAARTVARVLRGPDLALVAVCHMGFGVVIGAPASSPSPQPPRYLKEEGPRAPQQGVWRALTEVLGPEGQLWREEASSGAVGTCVYTGPLLSLAQVGSGSL